MISVRQRRLREVGQFGRSAWAADWRIADNRNPFQKPSTADPQHDRQANGVAEVDLTSVAHALKDLPYSIHGSFRRA